MRELFIAAEECDFVDERPPPAPTPNLPGCLPPSLPGRIAVPSSSRVGWALHRQREGPLLLLLVLALAMPEEKGAEEK